VITILSTEVPAVAERFWSKVQRGKCDECWPWLGWRDRDGYGRCKVNRRKHPATHLAIYLDRGEAVPSGLETLHTCDNPACCNPRHILVGTRRDNARDAMRKGRLRRREWHGMSKIDTPTAILIKAKLREGIPAAHVARSLGVSHHIVYDIKRGRTWRDVS
jgi:hypothetical protein